MRNAKLAGMIALGLLVGIVSGGPAQAQATWVKKYDAKRVTGLQVMTPQALAAVADDSILTSPNGGENWVVRMSELDAQLQALHLFDLQNGWAVGAPGVVLHFKSTAEGLAGGRLKAVEQSHLYCVYFLDPRQGWVGGANGLLMATEDAGLSWNRQTLRNPQGGGEAIRAVLFSSAKDGVALLGQRTLIQTDDGGKQWRPLAFAETVSLESLSQQGQTLWLSGGQKLTPTLTVARLWRSDDLGKTWKAVPVGELYGAVTSVWFADASTGYIAAKGKVYATADGGATWTEASDGSVAIEKVFGADANTLWGLGGGAIYHYTTAPAAAPTPPPADGGR